MRHTDEDTLKNDFDVQSRYVVKLAKELDKEIGITYLLGHLRELRLLSTFDNLGKDRYARREEALLHAVPILLKFGCQRIDLSSPNEIRNLLDNIERLMDLNDLVNIFDITPGIQLEKGMEVQFKGEAHPDFQDFQSFRLRLVQYHSQLNESVEFPSGWVNLFKVKLQYFDSILDSHLNLRVDTFVNFLVTVARAQIKKLNIGGQLFQSNKIAEMNGYSFAWDMSTFSWTNSELRELFFPNGDIYISNILKPFEFVVSDHQIPFILYKQIQFNPFIYLNDRWFFNVEYLLGSFIPMITHNLEEQVDNGRIPKKKFQKADERTLIEEVVAVLAEFGFKELFRNKKFFPNKNDKITEGTEIDLFFKSPCGNYLAVEVKGGQLSREMLYGLSFKGLLKEIGRTYKKVKQLEKQNRVIDSSFGKKKLREYIPDFDEKKKIAIISATRYPLFTNKKTKNLFCSVGELRDLLVREVSLFSDESPYEEMAIGREAKNRVPEQLQDVFSDGDFVVTADPLEKVNASKRIGWAVWINKSESYYSNEIEGKKAMIIFKSKRQAAYFAKQELKERQFILMDIYIGHPLLSIADRMGFAIFLVTSVKGSKVSGGFLEKSAALFGA